VKSNMTLPSPPFTPKQAAQILGVQVQTLALWRSTGRYPELRYYRVGRSIRYRADDVESWLASRAVGGPK
jgi:excisionase family DNA binding protein